MLQFSVVITGQLVTLRLVKALLLHTSFVRLLLFDTSSVFKALLPVKVNVVRLLLEQLMVCNEVGRLLKSVIRLLWQSSSVNAEQPSRSSEVSLPP